MSEWWNTLRESLRGAKFFVTHPWPVWAVAPILLGCIILIIFLYSKERRLVSRWTGNFLLAIRVILIILILMMLLEPVISMEWKKPVPGTVLVLVDKSLSMTVPAEVDSHGNKLLIAEALGYLPASARSRRPEELGHAALTAVKLLNQEVSPKLQTYQRHLLTPAGKTDAQSAKLREEAEKSVAAYLEKLGEVVRLSDTVARDFGSTAAAEISTLNDKKAAVETLLRGQLVSATQRIRPQDPAPAGTPAPAVAALPTGPDAIRKAAEAGETHLRAIKPLTEKLQKAADETLARSGRADIKEAITQVNKLSRADQVAALLGGERSKLLERMRGKETEQNELRLMMFDSEVKNVSIPTSLSEKSIRESFGTVDGAVTSLGDTLQRAVDSLNEDDRKKILGVVVFSDGQHTSKSGANPTDVAIAGALRNPKIRLYPVGVGDVDPPKDISVQKVDAPETVFVKDKPNIVLTFSTKGYEGKDFPYRVECKGMLLAEGSVHVPEGQTVVSTKVSIEPKWSGPEIVKIIVPPQEGEFLTDNNNRDIRITVVDKKLQVLIVDRDPRWEYVFLKRHLERDRFVELNHILLSALRPEQLRAGEQMPHGKGPGQFPANKEQIYPYKMIILGDLYPESLTKEDQENLISYVNDNGGVLVIISGKNAMPSRYRNEPLADLLPIIPAPPVMDWKPPGNFLQPFRLRLTPDGKQESFLALNPDMAANANAWAHLPPLYWFAPVQTKIKALATALVVVHPPEWVRKAGAEGVDAPDAKQLGDSAQLVKAFEDFPEGVPLLVTQPVGLGKVLWLGTDSTWRWRYKYADVLFDAFWGQILRWSSISHLTGQDQFVRLGPRKAEYEENETVIIESIVLYPNPRSPNREAIPLNDATGVTAVIYLGDPLKPESAKEVNRVPLRYRPGSGGFYRGETPGFKGGEYFIKLVASELPPRNPEAVATFRVTKNPAQEFYDVTLNETLLKEIAARSEGKYFNLSTVRDLPDELLHNVIKIPEQREIEAWNHWLLLVLFCFFLILEWSIRKWKGLV